MYAFLGFMIVHGWILVLFLASCYWAYNEYKNRSHVKNFLGRLNRGELKSLEKWVEHK